MASGNARDLVALKVSLEQIPALKCELQKLLDRLAFGANRPDENAANLRRLHCGICWSGEIFSVRFIPSGVISKAQE